VIVACAATLHAQGIAIEDADDAARALAPLAGDAAGALFGLGLVGAALLATAVVPLSTAYSMAEAAGQKADLNDPPREAPVFYGTYLGSLVLAGAIVLLPQAPLIDILVLSQALNAVLLLVILPVLRRLGADRALMGEHALGPAGRLATATVLVLVAASVVLLGLSALG
jgi:Mn2+/Fe2+ NRAMP family transporter